MVDDDGEALPHNRFLTSGIWRVATPGGTAIRKRLAAPEPMSASGEETAWDRHWTAGANSEQRWNYWRREALAYQKGVVNAYAGSGIVAPRCFHIDESEDVIELWLEDVDGRPGETWTIGEFATAATLLGRAQARYVGAASPSFAWLSHQFLRDYSSEKPVDWSLLDDDEAWNRPLVRQHMPADLRRVANELHARRERLYAIAEQLPRTFCHLDFWPKNLFRRGDEIVLIDWGLSGDGCLGEDIGNLVPDAVFDHFQPATALGELEEAVLTGYLTGLAEGGWRGSADLVRLGMWASAIKYDWLTPAMLAMATEERQLAYGGEHEVDAAYRFRERGAALLSNGRRGLDALALAEQVRQS